MQFPEVSALIELATLHADHQPDIHLCLRLLFTHLGASQSASRCQVPDVIPASTAITVLQLFPQVAPGLLPDVAAALAPSGFAGFHAEQLVLLDGLLGLCCLMCGGASSVKLQLCYWMLDKSGSHDLSLQEVLACIPALQLAGAAACIILRQTTRQALAAEQANLKAQAAMKQRWQLLSSILQQAFQEADSRATGVIKPHGDQVRTLLFSVAAQLTGLMIGAAPAASAAVRGSTNSSGNSRRSSSSAVPPGNVRFHEGSVTLPPPPPAAAAAAATGSAAPGQRLHLDAGSTAGSEITAGRARQEADLATAAGDAKDDGQESDDDSDRRASGVSTTGSSSSSSSSNSSPRRPEAWSNGEQQSTAARAAPAPAAAAAAESTMQATPTFLTQLPRPQQQQQQAGLASATAPFTAFAADAHSVFPQDPLQQQQQQHLSPGASGGEVADVVIMYKQGSLAHYQTEVGEAAAAAVNRRAPASVSGAVHLYTPQRPNEGLRPAGALSLVPETSLPRHLEALQQPQQPQQQQQQQQGVPDPSGQAYPWSSSCEGNLDHAAAPESAGDHPGLPTGISRRAMQLSGLLTKGIHPGYHSPVQGLLGLASEEGAAAGAVAAAGAQGGAFSIMNPQAAALDARTGQDVVGPALTTTAGNIAASIQRNIALASARVLVHCSVCFLLVTMVLLADIACVAALHLAAGMPLSVACAIAVGMNGALMLMLVSVLVVVRCVNANNSRSLTEVANGPQAQQLDSLLKSISTAIAALKVAEQQQQQHPLLQQQSELAGGTRRTTSGGTIYTAGGSYQLQDGAPAAAAAAAAAVPDDASGGLQLPFADKLRGIWNVVGRVAGFLPPEADALGGSNESVMRGGAIAMQGSGPRAVFSSSGGGAEGMGGGGSGLGAGYHQSRAVRIAGTASSAAAREGMYFMPSSNVRQAYPQL